MRAPAAIPAVSATASHSCRASDDAGSSRNPRPPTDVQSPRQHRAVARRDRERRGRCKPLAPSPPGEGEVPRRGRRDVSLHRSASPRAILRALPRSPASAAAELQIGIRPAQARARDEQHRDLGRRPRQPRSSPAPSACARAAAAAAGRRSRGHARSGCRPSSAASTVSRLRASSTAAAGGGSSHPHRADRRRPTTRNRAQRRQIRLQYLGRIESRQAGGRRLLPQSIEPSPAPAAPRGRRVGSRTPGSRARSPAASFPPRDHSGAAAPGPESIHYADAVERQGGLGDRRRQHELARPRAARSRRAGRRDRGCRGADAASRPGDALQPLGRALDLGDAGQEGEHAALLLGSARRIAAATESSIRASAGRGRCGAA